MDENTTSNTEEKIEEVNDEPALDATEEEPSERRILGLFPSQFYGILFGYGFGLVAAGLIGLVGIHEFESAMLPGIIGAAISYLIGTRLHKKNNS